MGSITCMTGKDSTKQERKVVFVYSTATKYKSVKRDTSPYGEWSLIKPAIANYSVHGINRTAYHLDWYL